MSAATAARRLHRELIASQADVSRLSAEVERLKADNQRYAHAVAEQGEIETELRQDVRRLEGERDGLRELVERFDRVYERGLSTDGQMYELGCLFREARRALSTPTGTRARAAAAAENQKAETPGSGTPPTEEGPNDGR